MAAHLPWLQNEGEHLLVHADPADRSAQTQGHIGRLLRHADYTAVNPEFGTMADARPWCSRLMRLA